MLDPDTSYTAKTKNGGVIYTHLEAPMRWMTDVRTARAGQWALALDGSKANEPHTLMDRGPVGTDTLGELVVREETLIRVVDLAVYNALMAAPYSQSTEYVRLLDGLRALQEGRVPPPNTRAWVAAGDALMVMEHGVDMETRDLAGAPAALPGSAAAWALTTTALSTWFGMRTSVELGRTREAVGQVQAVLRTAWRLGATLKGATGANIDTGPDAQVQRAAQWAILRWLMWAIYGDTLSWNERAEMSRTMRSAHGLSIEATAVLPHELRGDYESATPEEDRSPAIAWLFNGGNARVQWEEP